eukprot:SAG31_NODE_33_length_32018_cov_69.763088_23_plen_131_part_00
MLSMGAVAALRSAMSMWFTHWIPGRSADLGGRLVQEPLLLRELPVVPLDHVGGRLRWVANFFWHGRRAPTGSDASGHPSTVRGLLRDGFRFRGGGGGGRWARLGHRAWRCGRRLLCSGGLISLYRAVDTY